MFQLSMGARVRKSPFFDATVRAGVTHFTTYNHMLMATSYGDPLGEYTRLREGVSMWDVSCERQVEITGPDAAALTQYLCPRDLSDCVIGQGLYVPMCDHDGRIINDPVLLKLAEDRYWLSIADSDVLLWARAICAEKKFNAEVCEPDVSPLAIQGPKAEAVVSDLFGSWVTELKYFWFRQTDLDGIPLVVARSGWSKQGGFELYLMDGGRGIELWDKVAAAGAKYGIGPGTPNAIERVESALISYGTETDSETNPLELGLDKFIHLDMEADYVGKSALQNIAKTGPRRKLTGLLLSGDHAVPGIGERCPVSCDRKDVGYVSVTAHSPKLGRNIGIAMLQRTIVENQQSVVAHLPDGDYTAEIISLPFCE